MGIGFIMVAAIFPVAIQQGKVTNEETVAASVARGALSIIGQAANNSDSGETVSSAGTISLSYTNTSGGPLFPATGTFNSATNATQLTGNVWSIRDPGIASFPQADGIGGGSIGNATGRSADYIWNRISQSLVLPTDPRYAFVGLYRRDGNPFNRKTWSPFAQVWFIPVTARARSIYDGSISGNDVGTGGKNLTARMVQVRIDVVPGTTYTTQPTGGYILYNYTTVTANPSSNNYQPSRLGTGSYVIIGRDNIVGAGGTVVADSGRMNGRTYHVGVRRPDLDNNDTFGSFQAYELAPDGDFVPDAGADALFSTADDILALGIPTAITTPATTVYSSAPADAYIIGTDTASSDPGPAQDISAYSTFVKVN